MGGQGGGGIGEIIILLASHRTAPHLAFLSALPDPPFHGSFSFLKLLLISLTILLLIPPAETTSPPTNQTELVFKFESREPIQSVNIPPCSVTALLHVCHSVISLCHLTTLINTASNRKNNWKQIVFLLATWEGCGVVSSVAVRL